MYKKILIGYDGSEGAKEALHHAGRLAKELNAELTALWARSSLPHYPETVDEIDEERDAANSFLHDLSREVRTYAAEIDLEIKMDSISGHAPKTIVDYAKQGNYDLIVLGNAGHSGLWGNLLGHTPDKVSENAHCSVLIVR
jgi:nucleotide-binding universal stress UspA family protein